MSTRMMTSIMVMAAYTVVLLGTQRTCLGADVADATSRLLSKDHKKREEAQHQILQSRSATIEQLIQIIKGAPKKRSDDDSVIRAMKLLGEMRAVEAIDVLTELIAFPYVRPWQQVDAIFSPADASATIDKGYPAAAALVKIGKPCIPSIIDRSATSSYGITERGISLSVLLRLCTYEETERLLRSGIAKEKDPVRIRLLGGSLQLLRNRHGKKDKARSTKKRDRTH